MKDAWAEFGEDYTEENYLAYSKKAYYDPPMTNIEHAPEKNCFVICNDDMDNNQGCLELNKVLGLDDVEIDKEKVAQANFDRLKGMKVEEFKEEMNDREAEK